MPDKCTRHEIEWEKPDAREWLISESVMQRTEQAKSTIRSKVQIRDQVTRMGVKVYVLSTP